MIGRIVFGLCLGYEDCLDYKDLVDQDQLRHDPMFTVLEGKLRSGRNGGSSGQVRRVAEPAS
jgi:hypothetical protein